MLRISKLNVKKEGENILKNISIDMNISERVLLMGPNGSGKTSLARVVMGDPEYEVVSGSIELVENSKTTDLLSLEVHERARKGLFVSFQVPVALPGVSAYELLYAAYREIHEKCGGNENNEEEMLEINEFEEMMMQAAEKTGVPVGLLSRGVNEGFSGGEMKKLELLQMIVLNPKYVILDEPDSGLDADSVKLIRSAIDFLGDKTAVLLISHDPQRLGMKNFDCVYVMKNGGIAETGGVKLIKQVAEKGYE